MDRIDQPDACDRPWVYRPSEVSCRAQGHARMPDQRVLTMSGPFVRAVTDAIHCGSDNWAIQYYMDGGRWPDARETTFMESNKAWEGPEW